MPVKEKLTPGLLEAIRTRMTTARAVAKLLGVSESRLCRVLEELGVTREATEQAYVRKKQTVLAISRKNFRLELAKKALNREITIKEASKQAFCCERTMYRYMGSLR